MVHYLEGLLPWVEKPGRYLGGEVNALKKLYSPDTLCVCLAFPDVYEVGMSHLGLAILYGLLNPPLGNRFATPPGHASRKRAPAGPGGNSLRYCQIRIDSFHSWPLFQDPWFSR